MKIRVIKKKQILSFLPVKISMNDSPFKSLGIDETAEFETDTPKLKFTLNLFGMKRNFEFDPDPTKNAGFEMYFNLDKHQSLLVIMGFIAAFFLVVSGILDKNEGKLLVASSTFIIIFFVTLFHSMQLADKKNIEGKGI
jgi:hypothetical protein